MVHIEDVKVTTSTMSVNIHINNGNTIEIRPFVLKWNRNGGFLIEHNNNRKRKWSEVLHFTYDETPFAQEN